MHTVHAGTFVVWRPISTFWLDTAATAFFLNGWRSLNNGNAHARIGCITELVVSCATIGTETSSCHRLERTWSAADVTRSLEEISKTLVCKCSMPCKMEGLWQIRIHAPQFKFQAHYLQWVCHGCMLCWLLCLKCRHLGVSTKKWNNRIHDSSQRKHRKKHGWTKMNSENWLTLWKSENVQKRVEKK